MLTPTSYGIVLTEAGTGVPVALKSSASIQNELAGKSSGVCDMTENEKLFVHMVCGEVLSPQIKVPVCVEPQA